MPKSKGARAKKRKTGKGSKAGKAPRMKWTARDSVFTCLFRMPEYIRELYAALHPEDTDAAEKKIEIVTLENVLTNGEYNDLGFLVGEMLLILVEAQTTFTLNIALRLLLYVAETYRRFVEENKLNLYSSKTVKIPAPELVVIYTGEGKDIPEVIRLSELFAGGGEKYSLEMEVSVLRRRGTNDIIDQYIRFSEIVAEKEKLYGRTQKAIDAIFADCFAEGVLTTFLQSRQKEVRDMMTTLFNERFIQEVHDNTVRAEGMAEGERKGKAEEKTAFIMEMLLGREPMEKISRYTKTSMEQIMEIARSNGVQPAL